MAIEQSGYVGLGRRKTAVARVRLVPDGKGFFVNDKPLEEYIDCAEWRGDIYRPFELTGTRERFGVKCRVNGGGKSGQAGALMLGVARALVAADPNFRPPLRQAGFLTRDSRMVERKKYGLRKARRRPQFSKR
jgi:small subunit ribosomal protein S9